ncbi:hypothetical protein KP509_20G019400 [Ceratopteris richardii]|uniref:Protein kinase domain-containing protein n=1 Tax=Ceratopteris richardii TaxID=49495 RepID=A0A8T2SFF9_CERRI|nr:hypothetical protein KP509_20G019400 [Ceratopteris richardii]
MMTCCFCRHFSRNNAMRSKGHSSGARNAYASDFVHVYDNKAVENTVTEGSAQPIKSLELSIDEVRQATENFGEKALIGEDVFGKVYLGKFHDGRSMAIKRLDTNNHDESDDKFLAQISRVARVNNENVVKLIGYYVNGNMKVLAYELATVGSLYDILHGQKIVEGSQPRLSLGWMQRVKIAFEAAKDFSISDQPPDKAARLLSTHVLGTFGYNAPEYAMEAKSNYKSDIYSFGVVLLELLTGRKPIDHTLSQGQQSLVTWATARIIEGKVIECVDPRLNLNTLPLKAFSKMAHIASLCLQYDAELRPDTSTVVKVLGRLVAPKLATEAVSGTESVL